LSGVQVSREKRQFHRTGYFFRRTMADS
jgi:hypothetical protein